jgi:hypothetical protein
MHEDEEYLDCHDKDTLGDNCSTTESHFLRALKMLNKHADPTEFIKVYNGLMPVHLDLTFKSGFSTEQRKEHLQMPMDYNDNSLKMAQISPSDTRALAEAKLQDAVLYGRRVLLRAKRGTDVRRADLFQKGDKAIELIEQTLGKLRDPNHRSKEKSIAWGKDRQDRLRRL